MPNRSSDITEKPFLLQKSLVLFSLGFIPLLAAFFINLWEKPAYQFFPLALIGAGFLIVERIKTTNRPFTPGAAWVKWVLFGICLSLLLGGITLWSPWLGMIAAVVGGSYLAWITGGWPLIRSVLPGVVLLATIIPPPLGLDTKATIHLRSLAVNWSSTILDTLNVVHTLDGNVMEIPQKKLLVEEACSGINSILFVSAACLFYTLWRRRTLHRILLTWVASIGFVLMGNVFRITLGAWFEYYHHIDLLSGRRHEMLGLVLLAIYLGMIISFDELFLWIPERSARGQEKPIPPLNASSNPGFPRFGFLIPALFAVLGLVSIPMGWRFYQHQKNFIWNLTSSSKLSPHAIFNLPDQMGSWIQMPGGGKDNHSLLETTGIYSKAWKYRNGPIEATVAFDYPFRGYHDVKECYTSNGWNLVHTERITPSSGNDPARVEVGMRKGVQFGELWFTTLEEQGTSAETAELQQDLLNKWNLTPQSQTTTYRVQVLVTGYVPLSLVEHRDVTHFFEEARKNLSKQLYDQLAR